MGGGWVGGGGPSVLLSTKVQIFLRFKTFDLDFWSWQ